MNADFTKICRICMDEGVMMSIFKVNISKKIMSCAAVQVWQNDGLPGQICNKCSAKLHISFQFKKQCEKADAKLRQLISTISQENLQQRNDSLAVELPQSSKLQQITMQAQINPENCVYIECAPILEGVQTEQKFEAVFVPTTQQQPPPLTPINYNIQTQNSLQINNYSLQPVNQLPVYNGTYTMPIQSMQPAIVNNHIVTPQMTIQQPLQNVEPMMQQNPQEADDKDKLRKNDKIGRDIRNDTGKQCPTCNKQFANLTKLTRHMKTHSADMPYKCKICNKPFSHSGNYKIHMRMHTDERPFKCTVCDKGCRQAQDLEKHMRTHTGERPHKCNLCPKAFSTSSNLIAHIRIHTGERPYVCCVCQKAFCQSNELTKHMRTHTGEKSHVCDICHKGFNGSSTLIVHRRSHTGERPYTCGVCNKGFSQSSCLAVHMKRHTGERKFPCTVCDKTFITNSDLKEHMLTHTGAKAFNCNLCEKKFARANDLSRHSKTHTFKAIEES